MAYNTAAAKPRAPAGICGCAITGVNNFGTISPHLLFPLECNKTVFYLQYSITQEDGARDPSQHPCLQALPSIFHKAMKGIAAHVDAFLGMSQLTLRGIVGIYVIWDNFLLFENVEEIGRLGYNGKSNLKQ